MDRLTLVVRILASDLLVNLWLGPKGISRGLAVVQSAAGSNVTGTEKGHAKANCQYGFYPTVRFGAAAEEP